MKQTVDRIIIGIVVIVILAALLGDVSLASPNGGQSAVNFLQIGTSARAASMGNAYTAIATGTEATHWNPAGLANLTNAEAGFSHFAWYQDITVEHGSVAIPFNERLSIAASFSYLNYGNIEAYSAANEQVGTVDASDWTGGLSLGYAASDYWSVGAGVKYIRETLEDVSASGVAFDLGTRVDFDNFSVGLAAVNIGSGLSYESVTEALPTAVRLGVAVYPLNRNMTATMEYEHRRVGTALLRTGLEVSFQERYFLRAGQHSFVKGGKQSFSDGLSFGAGLNWNQATIDYAYTLADQYSSEDIHRFSFTVRF